jgi:hypothetical protein
MAGTRVAVGRMCGRLFVAHEDVTQPVRTVERIVERHDGATGVPKQHLDPRVDQGASQDLRTRQ